MFSFLKNQGQHPTPLTVDIHSHLLAGIDDGVRSPEEAVDIIRIFQDLGYQKAITTPHVMQDYYRNTPDIIKSKLAELKNVLLTRQITFTVEAAAEYYLDEALLEKLNAGEALLTFGDHYVLFETNMITEPYYLKDFIFKMTTSGYKPVLAHPERYAYMNLEKAEDLKDRGVLLQVNALSIGGFYSKPIEKMARQLIDKGWVDLIGSDCHHQQHALMLEAIQKNKYFQKALALPLLNMNL